MHSKSPSQFVLDGINRSPLPPAPLAIPTDPKAAGEYLRLKEAELVLKKGLPHLHGMKWYGWAFEFFESRNKLNLLCAANQISKSSTQIRKAIDWATNKEMWPALWDDVPTTGIYYYPTSNQITIEFETKWLQFLPKGDFKEHETYGWKKEVKDGVLFAIHFNSGFSIYFKSYKQGATALQSITAFVVFLDEECPEELWDEICFRVAGTNGYINMVFTATLGQEMWRKAMEPRDKDEELFKSAWKRQVSMYDCQTYVDGTSSKWTNERINQVIATCKSPQEVQKRVFGKFIKEEGLMYPQFDMGRHFKPAHHLPKDWPIYSAVDIGSGGNTGHPSGIVFVAVRPDYKAGRVISSWRGDGIRTTASDVLNKYMEMEKRLNADPVMRIYDWASAEFGEIANRNGISFVPADKSHEKGEQVLNVLFRNDMLIIYDADDNGKLAGEFCTVTHDRAKRSQVDDLIDPTRYIAVKVPWNWEDLLDGAKPQNEPPPERKLSRNEEEIAARRKAFEETKTENTIEDEFNAWNEAYGDFN